MNRYFLAFAALALVGCGQADSKLVKQSDSTSAKQSDLDKVAELFRAQIAVNAKVDHRLSKLEADLAEVKHAVQQQPPPATSASYVNRSSESPPSPTTMSRVCCTPSRSHCTPSRNAVVAPEPPQETPPDDTRALYESKRAERERDQARGYSDCKVTNTRPPMTGAYRDAYYVQPEDRFYSYDVRGRLIVFSQNTWILVSSTASTDRPYATPPPAQPLVLPPKIPVGDYTFTASDIRHAATPPEEYRSFASYPPPLYLVGDTFYSFLGVQRVRWKPGMATWMD